MSKKKTNVVLRTGRAIQIFHARDSLNRGLEIMRIICSGFDQDGRPHFDSKTLDTRAGLDQAIDQIKNTSDLLFEYTDDDADSQKSTAFLNVLWDFADVMICAKAALQNEKLPGGHGMTVCPVRGMGHPAGARRRSKREMGQIGAF